MSRLPDAFFDLRTGPAGEVAQVFVNHRLQLIVLGDVSRWTEASTAFRDWVREGERGGQVRFTPDLAALERLLAGQM